MTASRLERPRENQQIGGPPVVDRRPMLEAPALLWVLGGLASTLLMTVAGSRVADRRFHWWFRVVIGSSGTEQALFYLGAVGLVLAWLGLGRVARIERWPWSWMAIVSFTWSLPLLLGAPLFSHDIYSYLAQGAIAHLGLSPYRDAPVVLGQHGYQHLLAAVDPFWRGATAPYGPLFLGVISLIVALTGSHIFAGVMLVRLFDLVGLLLLAVFVPRLARRLGGDPTRATWLAVASPLILLQLVAPGHNDLLMAGLMVTGVALALERRPLLGIVVCVLAATIKVPAIAGALFIAVAWIRAGATFRDWTERAVKAALAALATAGAVTIVTGFGVGWISTALFSTPGRVRLAITPATDISFTLAKLLRYAGASVTFAEIESVLRVVLFALTVAVGLALLARTRWRTLPQYLGLTLVAFAIGGPALWPWYLAWGLVLLAAWRPTQTSPALIAVIVVGSFLVKPDGILLLSRGSSPIVVAVWAAIALLALVWWRRRSQIIRGSPRPPDSAGESSEYPDGLGSACSALAQR